MSTTSSSPVTVAEAQQYDADSLKRAIEKCQANIKLFEDTIDKERDTISRYQQMVTILAVHGKKDSK